MVRVVPAALCPLTSEALFLEPVVGVWVELAVPGRDAATGGCGKELMLTAFRIVFSGKFGVDFERDEEDLSVGMLGEDVSGWVVDNADGRGLDGILSLGGLGGLALILGRLVGTGKLFLGGLFGVGIGGRADVGALIAGGDM